VYKIFQEFQVLAKVKRKFWNPPKLKEEATPKDRVEV
jgi:hypothetical protein